MPVEGLAYSRVHISSGAPVRGGLRDLLALTRPAQWVKNVLGILVVLVGATGWSWSMALRLGWAIVVFTVASTVVYVINDIADRERDRRHPVKRHRPIAAGRVSPAAALVLAGVLVLVL